MLNALAVLLLLLSGCLDMEGGRARCRAMYGPDADYNGLADRCVDLSRPVNPAVFMPFMLNTPGPSHRAPLPPLTPAPMNRCNSLVIGNQIQTTCY